MCIALNTSSDEGIHRLDYQSRSLSLQTAPVRGKCNKRSYSHLKAYGWLALPFLNWSDVTARSVPLFCLYRFTACLFRESLPRPTSSLSLHPSPGEYPGNKPCLEGVLPSRMTRRLPASRRSVYVKRAGMWRTTSPAQRCGSRVWMKKGPSTRSRWARKNVERYIWTLFRSSYRNSLGWKVNTEQYMVPCHERQIYRSADVNVYRERTGRDCP